jgi:hypothetical protein
MWVNMTLVTNTNFIFFVKVFMKTEIKADNKIRTKGEQNQTSIEASNLKLKYFLICRTGND